MEGGVGLAQCAVKGMEYLEKTLLSSAKDSAQFVFLYDTTTL